MIAPYRNVHAIRLVFTLRYRGLAPLQADRKGGGFWSLIYSMSRSHAVSFLPERPIDEMSLNRHIGGQSLAKMSTRPTIAFVEDDPSFSRAVSRFLRVSGYEVHAYPSAEAFLEDFSDSDDCLIFDNHLPGISGLELFQRISSSASAQSVIFISAQDEGDMRAKTAQLPGCTFLRKPFVVTELLSAVQEQFARRANFPPLSDDPSSPQ